MAQITYKLVGNAKLRICIPLVSGTKIIFVDTIISPDGDKCVIYDNYIVSLKQMYQNATAIDFYINKMQMAYSNVIQCKSHSDTIKAMINSHVVQFGRIIDSDLMMMASAFARVLEAKDGSYQIHKIISESLDIAKAHFLDKLFITKEVFV